MGDMNFQHQKPEGEEEIQRVSKLRQSLEEEGLKDMWRKLYPKSFGATFYQWRQGGIKTSTRIDGIWSSS